MKTKNDPRHQSRVIALQKLFELEFKSNSPYQISELKNINESQFSNVSVDEQFVTEILNGVIKNFQEIDLLIKKFTLKRPFEDTSKIDLLILRMAVYELLYNKKAPIKVVIDEAVELAKEFGGEKSFMFINGVLGNISSDLNNAGVKQS